MKSNIPLKSFYFIRHGESEWNVLNKYAGGQTDTPLTQKGITQARDAAKIFDALDIKPDFIAHSTMCRASKTAEILNQSMKLDMTAYHDLRELDGGDWTGRVFAELNKKWMAGETPPNGESLDMFANRIKHVFLTILDTPKLPLIVAHGRILNAIEHGVGIKNRILQTQNCELLYFEPHQNKDRRYPWDVYICTLKNGLLHKEKAVWSQI